MRIFSCTIQNKGEGDIVWVDDKLESGEWTEGHAPSQDTKTIKPNETRFFEAVSETVPIVGSAITGTEGWALFKTRFAEFIGMPQEAFIRFSWNLPLVFFSFDQPKIVATRFDPRSPTPFDNQTPPLLKMSVIFAGPEGGDHLVDALPWLIVPPLVVLGAKLGVVVTLNVDGTVPPGSTKIPSFSDKKSAAPIAEPLSNTNPSMWTGTWSSERVQARIRRNDDSTLDVTIAENGGSPTEFTTHGVVISRVVYAFASTEFVGSTAISSPEESGFEDQIKLYVQEGLGTARASSKPINRRTQAYKEIVSGNPAIVGSLVSRQHQIGGDFLRLDRHAMLEIHRLMEKGQVVDVALRYRRPASIPSLRSLSHFDEMLYFRPDVH
jgi:hypothetical protein